MGRGRRAAGPYAGPLSGWPEITEAVLIGHNLGIDPMRVLERDDEDLEVYRALSNAAVALQDRINAARKAAPR